MSFVEELKARFDGSLGKGINKLALQGPRMDRDKENHNELDQEEQDGEEFVDKTIICSGEKEPETNGNLERTNDIKDKQKEKFFTKPNRAGRQKFAMKTMKTMCDEDDSGDENAKRTEPSNVDVANADNEQIEKLGTIGMLVEELNQKVNQAVKDQNMDATECKNKKKEQLDTPNIYSIIFKELGKTMSFVSAKKRHNLSSLDNLTSNSLRKVIADCSAVIRKSKEEMKKVQTKRDEDLVDQLVKNRETEEKMEYMEIEIESLTEKEKKSNHQVERMNSFVQKSNMEIEKKDDELGMHEDEIARQTRIIKQLEKELEEKDSEFARQRATIEDLQVEVELKELEIMKQNDKIFQFQSQIEELVEIFMEKNGGKMVEQLDMHERRLANLSEKCSLLLSKRSLAKSKSKSSSSKLFRRRSKSPSLRKQSKEVYD